MKIAVVYNRNSLNVINLFGMLNQEKIGLKTINRLVSGLKEGGHEVIALEGDKTRGEALILWGLTSFRSASSTPSVSFFLPIVMIRGVTIAQAP